MPASASCFIAITPDDARAWLALRSVALAALALRAFNPSLRNEERENLSDIAIAVVDHSQSQEFRQPHASSTDAARNALKQAVARLGNIELRVVTARSGITGGE